jgi:hypothetical protein
MCSSIFFIKTRDPKHNFTFKSRPKATKRQSLQMTDRELLEICIKEIAATYGYPDVKLLRQRDLEHLCLQVDKSSGIMISLSTMKRMVNGQFIRLPQIATLNAFALCLGYQNWQDFKIRKQQVPRPPLSAPPHPPAQKVPTPLRKIPWKLISSGLAVILVAITLSANHFSSRTGSEIRTRKADVAAAPDTAVTFTARRTTHNDIPNTVIFNYNVDNMAGDSFFIQQSWDRNRRVRIYKHKYTLTDIYYEPGYHNAKLIVNEQVIKTIGISIPTDQWFFYSKESLTRGYPSYITPTDPVRNGVLSLRPEDLVKSRIDPQKPQVYLYTYFPGKMEAEGDNFHLTSRIRMKELRNTACPMIMLETFCQHNFMYFASTLPGCISNISVQFGEWRLDGKENDLSGFGCDVRAWHVFDMLVQDRQVTIAIDGKKVFSGSYASSAGLITGLGFISNGLCEVDAVELKGLNGKTVYRNDFENGLPQ